MSLDSKGPVSSDSHRPPLLWVEAARTLLMAGVVLVHANTLFSPAPISWWPFGYWTCVPTGILVPAFFVISGLVTGLGNFTSPAFDSGRFLRRKVATLVVPLLVWNALMVGLHLLLNEEEPLSSGQLWLKLLTGYWHLYFVTALLLCFGLFLLLRRWLVGRGLWVVLAGAGLVSAAYYGLASWLLWTGLRTDDLFEATLNRTFAPWSFFFFLGVVLGQRPAARAALGRYFWLFGLLALGAFPLFLEEMRAAAAAFFPASPVVQFLAGGFPFQVLGALAYVGLFERLSHVRGCERPLRGVARLAPLSLGVYLCHNAILMPLAALWTKLGWPAAAALEVPSLFVAGGLLAVGAVAVGRRLGWPGRVLFASRDVASPGRQASRARGSRGEGVT